MTEHDEQSALLRWWGLYAITKKLDARLLFAIPNAGKRSVRVASMMRAEGLRAGIPDLFLAIPKNDFGGLFIEMKRTKGGVLSKLQAECLEMLKSAGYACAVCRGSAQAQQAIENYLSRENTGV